MNELAVEWM